MLKKTIAYTDFEGVDRKEDFYFNLTKSEITKMELSIPGGLVQRIEKVVAEQDGSEIMKLFNEIILAAYGEKSADGKYFQKSEELAVKFSWTMAYDTLFNELCTDPDAAAAFFNGIIPQVDKQLPK